MVFIFLPADLLNMEILEKDLKMVTGTAMTIAMCSVTMDMKVWQNLMFMSGVIS